MTVDLWPAIDIADGRCVRLLRGDFAAVTEYGDPESVARSYVEAGAARLHVVDLDAARGGEPLNRDVVVRIAAGCGVPVQAGGGIRSAGAAAALLGGGVARVVVGTAALEEPELLAELVAAWPSRVAVGLDHRRLAGATSPGDLAGRELAVRGWSGSSGTTLAAALEALSGLEPAAVVVTDISRDGTLTGPDLDGLSGVLSASRLPVVASGGVADTTQLKALAALSAAGRSLAGVIVGRALLDGSLTIASAEAALAAGRRSRSGPVGGAEDDAVGDA